MNTNQIERTKASSKIEESLIKLSFLADVISLWNEDNPIDTNQQYGFALCMEDTITDIENSIRILENSNDIRSK